MPGAAENSRLAAVSDRATSGVVRLYYQGDDKKIWEGLWTSDGCSNRKSSLRLKRDREVSANLLNM